MIKELEATNERVVRQTFVDGPLGKHVVSTVCLDPALERVDAVLSLFYPRMGVSGSYESMVFEAEEGPEEWRADQLELYMRRYFSKEEAKEGHEEIVSDLDAGALLLCAPESEFVEGERSE